MDGLYSMPVSLNNMATNLRGPITLDMYDSFMATGDKFCGGGDNVAAVHHLRSSSFHSFPFLLNNNTLMSSSCVSSHHLHSLSPHFLSPDFGSSQIWHGNLPNISSCSSGDDDFIRPPLLFEGLTGASGSSRITSMGGAVNVVIPCEPSQDSPTSSIGMSSNKTCNFPSVEKSSSSNNPCKILNHHVNGSNFMKKEQNEQVNHTFGGLSLLEDICLIGMTSTNTSNSPCVEKSCSSESPCKILDYNDNGLNSMTEEQQEVNCKFGHLSSLEDIGHVGKSSSKASNVLCVENVCSSGAPCKTLDEHGNVLNVMKEEEEERKKEMNHDCGGFSFLETIGLGDDCLSTLVWESYMKNMQQPLVGLEAQPESSAPNAFSRELEEFDDFLASLKRMQEKQSIDDDQASLTKGCVSTPSKTLGHVSFWDPSTNLEDAFGSTVTNDCKERARILPGMVSMPSAHQERYAKLQKVDHYMGSASFESMPMLLQQAPRGVGLPTRRSEQVQVGKKRSRSGENPRPRPKDRQQIQDCVLELRNIIPSSKKCSIDALLEKTIKYINFLQTVTMKWNETIKLQEGKDNGPSTNFGGGGGASWAVELGEEGKPCPIVVENLRQPGQFLVEMLCEEENVILDIPESIKKSGLTILKGIMETRNDKLWAKFVVEADREVHRLEVLWSLMQLLESGDTKASSNVINPQ